MNVRTHKFLPRLAAVASAVALAATLASCGGGPTGSSATSSSSTGSASNVGVNQGAPEPQAAQTFLEQSTVTVVGHTVAVPREGTRIISAQLDDGTAIVISPYGFLPRTLFAHPGRAITWTNLTSKTQHITFEHSSVRSGAIPPGGTFTWTPTTEISVDYLSSSGSVGNISASFSFP